MSTLEYEAVLPFPAARLELSLSTREEPIALREFAVVIEVMEPDGSIVPKGLLNWGYSSPLGGCYQYVPATPEGGLARIGLPIITERAVGGLRVKVVAWRPAVPGTDAREMFDRLLITFSAADAPSLGARFSTVRRSDHG